MYKFSNTKNVYFALFLGISIFIKKCDFLKVPKV